MAIDILPKFSSSQYPTVELANNPAFVLAGKDHAPHQEADLGATPFSIDDEPTGAGERPGYSQEPYPRSLDEINRLLDDIEERSARPESEDPMGRVFWAHEAGRIALLLDPAKPKMASEKRSASGEQKTTIDRTYRLFMGIVATSNFNAQKIVNNGLGQADNEISFFRDLENTASENIRKALGGAANYFSKSGLLDIRAKRYAQTARRLKNEIEALKDDQLGEITIKLAA